MHMRCETEGRQPNVLAECLFRQNQSQTVTSLFPLYRFISPFISLYALGPDTRDERLLWLWRPTTRGQTVERLLPTFQSSFDRRA